MCIKKLLVGFIATSLVLAAGTPCFASAASATDEGIVSVETAKKDHEDRPELTKEQKEEREARKERFEAAQKKWSALTKAQKEKIYALQQKADDVKLQMIDEYVALGIIDEAAAKEIKAHISDRFNKMKSDDRMPMIWCKRKPK